MSKDTGTNNTDNHNMVVLLNIDKLTYKRTMLLAEIKNKNIDRYINDVLKSNIYDNRSILKELKNGDDLR